MNNKQLWSQQSSQWSHMGSPQRPCAEDISIFTQLIDAVDTDGAQPIACILGVTPEVTQLDWPAHWQTIAVDNNPAMIKQLWQPHPIVASRVMTCDWQTLALNDAQMTVVIGDGITTAMGSVEACRRAFQEFRRVLTPRGRLILRCFIRPPTTLSLAQLVAAVNAQAFSHFGVLKWQLAMALTDDSSDSVAPQYVLDTFNQLFPDRHWLAAQLHCPLETVNTIDAYQTQTARLVFMTEATLLAQLKSDFILEKRVYPSYPLGECCPIYCFQAA